MPFDLRRQHEKYTIGLIEDAFMDLYEKKGLSLTVNEICEKTGVSRPVSSIPHKAQEGIRTTGRSRTRSDL